MSGRDDDLMRGRANSATSAPAPAREGNARAFADEVRQRQRASATVLAWLLGGFVFLVFAISIVKIALNYG